MNTRFRHSRSLFVGLFVTLTAMLPAAAPGQGVPFEQLQLQIEALNTQVQALMSQVGGGDQGVTVACTPSDTVSAALAKATPGGRLTIDLNGGTCTENVTIERDRVTLKNGTLAGTGAVQPVIEILGARGVVIENLSVQGGASHGVFATRNADVTIRNSTVQNNARDGVQLRWGAFGDISGSTITGNAECAVSPRDGAIVLLTDNPLITTAQPNANICATIGAYRSTTVVLAGGNNITNTGGGAAMDIIQGSAVRAQNGVDTISGQVFVSRLANVDLRNASITGNITVASGAWLGVRAPSSITGSILVDSRASVVEFQGVPTVTGTVTCFGSATVGLSPNVPLTLVVPPQAVQTSQSGVAWAFRGIAVGNIAGGVFSGCN